MNDPDATPSALPPALLSTWLAQSHDLLVLTDTDGRIVWANSGFVDATGATAADLPALLHAEPGGEAGRQAMHAVLMQALQTGSLAADTALCLRGTDGAGLWLRARAARVGRQVLWTLQPGAAPANDNARLELALELAGIVTWRHDLTSNRVRFNEHGFGVLEVPPRPEGLPLAELRSLIHPDDLPRLQRLAELALHSAVPTDIHARHRRADGSWRDLLTRRVVERNARGEAIAFVGVALDVTEQSEQSRRAAALGLRLEAAAKAARIGIWTITSGAGHTEWNAQMFELFDMVGEPRPSSVREWMNRCIHPADVERVHRALGAYHHDPSGKPLEIEFRACRRDSSVRWIVLRADADRSDPQSQRFFGVALDVTAHREAVAALHQAGERAALITRSAGLGTWETGLDFEDAVWDEQMFRLRGLEPRRDALKREERLALVHPDDTRRVLDSHEESTAPRFNAYEFRVRWPDGSYRWLASRSAVLLDADGQPVRRVGVNWDVTEARNADAERQKSQLAERESRAKSQFLSRMSHELRTPLNAVLGFAQLLQGEVDPVRARGQSVKLGHIRTAGEHLLALINDTLDLSSMEAGTLRLEIQDVDLATTLAQAVPLVSGLAPELRIRLHTDAAVGRVRADPLRLRQVLINLLSNAIKYNRLHGEVTVESATHPDGTCLRVRDTGRGLSADQLGHLFEPFNRLGIESEGIPGSGIGLTVVKALVEGMGGRVTVSSEVGRGTVFELTLPTSDAVVPSLSPPHHEPGARSGQLLYIEDNSVNVLLVEELVKSLSGLQITSESTGTAGVARALSLRPDVILVDMQLPDFDGFEVLRRLRARPETAAIPCIALSANAMPEDIARGLAGGFDDYWTKPIKFRPFLESLERLFPAEAVRRPAPPGRAA